MNPRHSAIGLILVLAAVVSCGTDNGTTSPDPVDGVLLRASDLPAMRLRFADPIADAAGVADVLGGPEACACPTVFKDDAPVVIGKMQELGFKRGYRELWAGAGLHASAFAAEFDSASHAKAALDYMNTELFRECVDEPYCSRRDKVEDAKIPGFVGLGITPLRPKEEGRRAVFYKILFQSGAIVYGVMDGADDAYDPGSVSQAQALTLAERLYDRVKGRPIGEILGSAPSTSIGPPHGPEPVGSPT